MEGSARCSRARSQLRGHADVADKYAAETLGSGRKIAGLICNQGFIDTTRLAWQAWMWKRRSTWPSPLWCQALFLWQEWMGMWWRVCRRDEGRDGIRLASRTVRRRFATQNVFRVVEMSGQTRAVESRGKWKTRGWEICCRREIRQRELIQWYDVGRQLLTTQRQQRTVVVHGDRYYRRVAGLGHGVQTRIAVVDEH